MSYQKKYSEEFKKAAVEKVLSRGARTVAEVLEELGVPSPTLYQWRSNFSKLGTMKKSTRPQDRSSAEKLKVVNEYESASSDERGELLRRSGVHQEHVESWIKQIHLSLNAGGIGKHVERSERALDRRRIKELENDLRRKDRALAETTALLVLKKKADLIWGTEENE
jgi:transposase-like protein